MAYGLGANLRAARVSAVPRLTVWDDVVPAESVDASGRVLVPLGTADWVRVYREDPTQPGTPSLAGVKLAQDPAGVKVEAVRPPGAGERLPPDDPRAVFQAGDIVEGLEGAPVASPARLRLRVEGLPWDRPAQVTVRRGGSSVRLTFVPRRPPSEP